MKDSLILSYLYGAMTNANQADRPNSPWLAAGAGQKDDPLDHWNRDMGPSYNVATPKTRQHYVNISLGLWDVALREGITTC